MPVHNPSLKHSLKIAHIFQPPWNPHVHIGLGNWNYHVTRRLAKECKLIVYCAASPRHEKVECLDGVEYRSVSVRFDQWLQRYLEALSRRSLLRSPVFASGAYYVGFILQVAFDLRRQKCDIVHIHNLSQFVPIIRALNPRIRIVLHAHGEWLTQLKRRIIEPRLEKVDLIVACSEFVAARIRKCYPAHAKRCHTVFMGVEPGIFFPDARREDAPPARHKRLLYVGRLSPEKGVHVLLEAFKKIRAVLPDAELEIVGPDWIMPREYLVDFASEPGLAALKVFYNGSYRTFLQNQISPADAESVRFRGLVLHPELVQYYRDADVFIFPSFYESLGMSAIEAMATELPVVATAAGGVPEVVENGKTGLLVPPGDVGELAKAIICLLTNDELRFSMGAAGRKRAAQIFSYEAISKRLMGLYETDYEASASN